MHDENELHEPEHDHLLDHEFAEDFDPEADAYGALDEVEDDPEQADEPVDELDAHDDGYDHPAWFDDCDD